MATIKMTSGFTLCPQGTHVFRVYKVDYNIDFGKLEVHLINAQGITHIERFSLMNSNGEMNEKACAAFSFFAKTVLQDFSRESIDHEELVNHYIKAEVVHTTVPNRNDPAKTVTFANLGDKWEADGFDTEPCEKALTLGNPSQSAPAQPTPAPTEQATGLDLNELLN